MRGTENRDRFILRFPGLPMLPIAHGPGGHHWRFRRGVNMQIGIIADTHSKIRREALEGIERLGRDPPCR
jgi:hypothetical protein